MTKVSVSQNHLVAPKSLEQADKTEQAQSIAGKATHQGRKVAWRRPVPNAHYTSAKQFARQFHQPPILPEDATLPARKATQLFAPPARMQN